MHTNNAQSLKLELSLVIVVFVLTESFFFEEEIFVKVKSIIDNELNGGIFHVLELIWEQSFEKKINP